MIDWYQDAYANDPATDNVFGREDLAERSAANHLSRNAATLARIQAYGFRATFPRPSTASVIPMVDRALGLAGACK